MGGGGGGRGVARGGRGRSGMGVVFSLVSTRKRIVAGVGEGVEWGGEVGWRGRT